LKRAIFLLAAALGGPAAADSSCFGTVSHGRLEGAVALPLKGANFQAHTDSPIVEGRRFVHARIADIVVEAYAEVRERLPDAKFMYGETGLEKGGPFKPHRTHQNGLSVDFFVPVRDLNGQPVLLPTALGNRFGYDIEFDLQGRYANYQIDFTALAEHLYQLHRATVRRGGDITLVILDPAYLGKVLATARGDYLKQHSPFMRRKPWVRHDEHVHVDFYLRCEAIDAPAAAPARAPAAAPRPLAPSAPPVSAPVPSPAPSPAPPAAPAAVPPAA
jgi:penicillin-insensitive murein endopeptidase